MLGSPYFLGALHGFWAPALLGLLGCFVHTRIYSDRWITFWLFHDAVSSLVQPDCYSGQEIRDGADLSYPMMMERTANR